MRYRTSAVGVGVFILTIAVVMVDSAQSAPRRPSISASACSVSADKFNQLAARNPSGAAACKNMANDAQARGGSFAFMCDSATGEISCCNESTCVGLGTAMKGRLPGLRPDQLPGTLQQQPSTQPPGGKPGAAPPRGVMPPTAR